MYFTDTVRGRPTALYLVERTLMRPRELIQLANLCRDTAAKNGHSRILEADILEAEVQYSVWKIQDLVTEYALTYPFLNDLLVLFQSAPYLVEYSDLAERMGALAATLSARYPRFTDVFTSSAVATVLYGIGFLGVRRNEAFAYAYEGGLPLDGDEQEFCLHPCFRQALRAVAASRLTQSNRWLPGPVSNIYRTVAGGGVQTLAIAAATAICSSMPWIRLLSGH